MLRPIKIYWNEAAGHLLLPHIKLFLNNNKRSRISLPALFSAWLFKKNILLYSINWPNFMLYLPLLCEILDNMYIVTGSNIITFKIKLIVLIKPFFSTWPKSQDKYIENEKNFYGYNEGLLLLSWYVVLTSNFG